MAESALRILLLCVAAALVCASLRMLHPQIATAVALACGIAAMMLSLGDISGLLNTIRQFESYADSGGIVQVKLLKTCSIAMVAEFASDICRDSNEIALSRRIDTGVKIGILASALPLAGQIMQRISTLIP